jgi:hypothetical protein
MAEAEASIAVDTLPPLLKTGSQEPAGGFGRQQLP